MATTARSTTTATRITGSHKVAQIPRSQLGAIWQLQTSRLGDRPTRRRVIAATGPQRTPKRSSQSGVLLPLLLLLLVVVQRQKQFALCARTWPKLAFDHKLGHALALGQEQLWDQSCNQDKKG
ncbi:hypothetical protein M5D96_002932 [Drosophila gunungcola]|uniref:Uncharacterized protein n=1 Tax=Drosophila gunungcola TaxID=103775 RepID=A0A9P9Z0Z2_9MUSC|nr:hypothetical protein M5D96_002932 [Drosophila gunungcola]